MNAINENGRSMVEMLGVLAIIGVLSVGGLSIIGKARQQSATTTLISEISNLAMNARKLSCDYDDGYGSYTNMLFQSAEYPEGVSGLKCKDEDCDDYDNISSGKCDAFLLSSDAIVKITAADANFEIAISNIPEESCVALASSDWGKRNINGFLGSSIGSSSSDNDNKMDLDDATSGCTYTNGVSPTLTLTYLACQRGGDE